MARRVQFNEEYDDSNADHPRRQFPTPRPKFLPETSNSEEEEAMPIQRLPDLPVRRRRRQKKGKKGSGSSSDSYRRRGHIANTRKDRRRSDKERKRRSDLAKRMPRGLDGKFVSKYDKTTPRLSSTPQYSAPQFTPIPVYSSASAYSSSDQEPAMNIQGFLTPQRQQQQSNNDESFLDTSMPKMPGGKFVKEIFQTPEFQKALKAAVAGQKQQDDDNDDESFLDTSMPKMPEGKFIKQIFQTPGFQKLLGDAIVAAVQSSVGKKPLNFDDSEDEGEEKKVPRRRRSSSKFQT
uniref:Uncharacterized protein n=1 Tax=Panagrolaimus sp. ES5 TaxID=591445 RepID=A0AC34FAI5_9BILA